MTIYKKFLFFLPDVLWGTTGLPWTKQYVVHYSILCVCRNAQKPAIGWTSQTKEFIETYSNAHNDYEKCVFLSVDEMTGRLWEF